MVLTDPNGLASDDSPDLKSYRSLADTLRADTSDVSVVQDFVTTPPLKPMMFSQDGKAAYLAVGLKPAAGSPESTEANQRIVATAQKAAAGTGLTVHVTGQAAIVADMANLSSQ